MFSNNTKLRYLSLGHNAFTELPSGLLDGLNALAEVHLYATELECTCEKVWLFTHAETSRTKLRGDIICSSPPNWKGK